MKPQDVIDFAVERWYAEVSARPLNNIHRSALDSSWRSLIEWAGGDPEMLIGPKHQDLVEEALDVGAM